MPNVYIEPRPKGRPEGDPTPQGARNWVLRYMLNGRPRWMGLGPLALYSLAEARAKALDSRRKRHEGIDPIDARRAERARLRLDAANSLRCHPRGALDHRSRPWQSRGRRFDFTGSQRPAPNVA